MAVEAPARLVLADGTTIDATNYADLAEAAMLDITEDNRRERNSSRQLTTTKLRKIYGQILNTYARIDEPSAFERYRSELQYLKVRMAYEAGREQSVKRFLEKTGLMRAIDAVQSYEQFNLYCRYAESLVAYFKFYGGRDR